jgi:hypothetical protein
MTVNDFAGWYNALGYRHDGSFHVGESVPRFTPYLDRTTPCRRLILVLPLSFTTIRMLPALNGSTDELHSIKMGYPVFWAALIVPLALRIGRKTRKVQHQQGTRT